MELGTVNTQTRGGELGHLKKKVTFTTFNCLPQNIYRALDDRGPTSSLLASEDWQTTSTHTSSPR